MEEAALKVMEAATATEALLAEKAVALGAIRAEFERKQKEVGRDLARVHATDLHA